MSQFGEYVGRCPRRREMPSIMIAPWDECKLAQTSRNPPQVRGTLRGARILDAQRRYNRGWQASDVAHEA
jgi:hypothetical protein